LIVAFERFAADHGGAEEEIGGDVGTLLKIVAYDHRALSRGSGALRSFERIQPSLAIQLVKKPSFEHRTGDIIVAAEAATDRPSIERRNGNVLGLGPTNWATDRLQIGHSYAPRISPNAWARLIAQKIALSDGMELLP